jgi:hypothetical protein
VGQKLWRLTEAGGDAISHQVLCVTHLPQLAGYGDLHFKVEKQVISSPDSEGGEQRTVTGVRALEGAEKVEVNLLISRRDSLLHQQVVMIQDEARVAYRAKRYSVDSEGRCSTTAFPGCG